MAPSRAGLLALDRRGLRRRWVRGSCVARSMTKMEHRLKLANNKLTSGGGSICHRIPHTLLTWGVSGFATTLVAVFAVLNLAKQVCCLNVFFGGGYS